MTYDKDVQCVTSRNAHDGFYSEHGVKSSHHLSAEGISEEGEPGNQREGT